MAQAVVQVPQCARSVWRFVHAAAVPVPQSVEPMAQAQRPAVQVCPPVQALPQAPQLVASVCVFTQAPPQSVVPVAQAQAPAVQTRPIGQAVPQVPQFAASVWRFTQVRPQTDWPVGHTQRPAAQV